MGFVIPLVLILVSVVFLPVWAVESDSKIPSWIINNVELYSQGKITDKEFVDSIQYLVDKKILVISGLDKEIQNELNYLKSKNTVNQDELNTLRAENEQYRNEILDLKSQKPQNGVSNSDALNYFKNENEKLQDDINALKAENKEYQRALDSAVIDTQSKNELKAVKTEIGKYQDQINSLKTANDQYKNDILSITAKNRQFQDQLDSINAQNTEYRKELDSLNSTHTINLDVLNSLKTEIAKYQDQINSLKTENDQNKETLQTVKANNSRYQDQLVSLKTENEQYKQKLGQQQLVQATGKDVDSLKNAIGKYQDQLVSLKTQNDQYKETLQTLMSQSDKYQDQLASLKNENEDYKHKLDSQQSKQVNGLDANYLKNQNNEYTKNIEELKTKSVEYEIQLNYLKAKSAVNQDELSTLRSENEEYRLKLGSLTDENSKPSSHLTELSYDKLHEIRQNLKGISERAKDLDCSNNKDTSEISQTPASYDIIKNGMKNYYVYVEPLPDWAKNAENSVDDAINYWESTTGVTFHKVDTPERATVTVKWVKEFSEKSDGYTINQRFVEIGIGKSHCDGKWQSYDSNSITLLMEHEFGHVLGLEHSSDPSNIMYPIIPHAKYSVVDKEYSLGPNNAIFINGCTLNDATTYDYQVSIGDSHHGFDVFFVPSKGEYDKYVKGQKFQYYSAGDCFAINHLLAVGTCYGVTNTAGLLIITPEELDQTPTKIKVKIQEK
ncbi:MAG: matrixin family metalloprotease [Thaumarchaeota archaeon]|nr:matrixin family metalloprotease [Nitrososphaerota archaeon]